MTNSTCLPGQLLLPGAYAFLTVCYGELALLGAGREGALSQSSPLLHHITITVMHI